jgi:Polyketide cyclase / dehydrase and lipid transport
MGPVSAATTIDAPRERVCELVCDLSARPAFTDHFLSEYRLQRLDPMGVGAAARFELGESGKWMETVIVEIDDAHMVREEGRGARGNRVRCYTVWELVEGPSAGICEVSVTFWTESDHLVDRLKEPLKRARWFSRGWRRALARLKEVAESEAPIERVAVAGADRV